MLTHFSYSGELSERFPQLHALVAFVEGVEAGADATATIDTHLACAQRKLAEHGTESNLEPVQAWRTAYRATGTDPTKFRMAAESILRRLRTTGEFSRHLHPMVLLCNALSARFGVPVAALDARRIVGDLQVRTTDEPVRYEAFDGSVSTLEPGEVSFIDAAGNAHARKWSHKQSALSAVSHQTCAALLIAEAMHPAAEEDLGLLQPLLADAMRLHWPNARLSFHGLCGGRLVEGVAAPFDGRETSLPQPPQLSFTWRSQ